MTVKIKLNTWQKGINRTTKFKRNLAPREGYIEQCSKTGAFFLKPGETKWKPFDTTISRKTDKEYIKTRKQVYSGLCFKGRKEAKEFMETHKELLDKIASENPLFTKWSIIHINKRFEPDNKTLYTLNNQKIKGNSNG